MKLLLVRHGIAEEPEAAYARGISDDARELTPEGVAKMLAAAPAFKQLVPEISRFVSSPLVRARQTAEIVAAQYGAPPLEIAPVLRPESAPQAVCEWIASNHPAVDVIALFGHMPLMSLLAGYLLTGNRSATIEFKKGGAALLSLAPNTFPTSMAGKAELLWALKPGELRAMVA